MKYLDRVLDVDNLKLAWQRVLQSRRHFLKDITALRIFEDNLEAELNTLTYKLREDVFVPTYSQRLHQPKKYGTLRTFPVLTISDRIVYQAVMNIVSIDASEEIEAVLTNHVFAHLPNGNYDATFIRPWAGENGQYKQFTKRLIYLLGEGNNWIVKTDIASFYDNIDHTKLQSTLERWIPDENIIDTIINCFKVWMSPDQKSHISRGIPQGYEASDFLATLSLMPIDEYMNQLSNSSYVRYVDDIYILSSDKQDANKALIELDLQLQEYGLILQPSKTGVSYKTSADDLETIVTEISVIPEDEEDKETTAQIETLWKLYCQNPSKQIEAALIHFLNLMAPSEASKKVAIEAMGSLYHRSSEITRHLSGFWRDDEVREALYREARTHKVYGWHLANVIVALANVASVAFYRKLCLGWIRNLELPWYQRLAALECLQNDEESYSALLVHFNKEPNQTIKANIVITLVSESILTMFHNKDNNVVDYTVKQQKTLALRRGLQDNSHYVRWVSAWLAGEFSNHSIKSSDIPDDYKYLYEDNTSQKTYNESFIGLQLEKHFLIQLHYGLDFRQIFGQEYTHAAETLKRSIKNLQTDIDAFITYLDTFNQIIAIKMTRELIQNVSIPEDQFPQMLGIMQKQYPHLSTSFQSCHNLRSKCRLPHAWSKSSGTWSISVSHREKDNIINALRVGYQEFVDAYANHFGI